MLVLGLMGALAHGVWGIWDEILPIVLAGIFTAILIWVWLKGRNFEPEIADEEPQHDSE